MKKETIYLIEYLRKSTHTPEHAFYECIAQTLKALELYHPSRYTLTQILSLMHHQNQTAPKDAQEAVKMLDSLLETALPLPLQEAKKTLFMTLLHSNFPKKKSFLTVSLELFLSQLEPVEKSIYENLLAYVSGLNRALSLFFVLSLEEPNTFTPEALVHFGETVHVTLIELLLNEEERGHLSNGLKELLGVYLSLYGKYLYM